MEKKTIDEAQKKRMQRTTMGVIIGITVVLAAYIVYALVSKNLNSVIFGILLAVFLLTYTVMTDIYEPWQMGLLTNMTIGQRSAFTKIMVADVIGVGALLYWIVGMGSDQNNEILFPVLIYFLAMQMKRKFRPELEGIGEDDSAE